MCQALSGFSFPITAKVWGGGEGGKGEHWIGESSVGKNHEDLSLDSRAIKAVGGWRQEDSWDSGAASLGPGSVREPVSRE